MSTVTTTTTTTVAATAPVPRVELQPWTKRIRRGWLLELGVGVALYFLYDSLRDRVMGASGVALTNARDVVHVERLVGLYQERTIQGWFLHWDAFLAFWNVYYGTIHFVMPVVALVVLYRKAPARYVRWRNALLFMLALGLVGFWVAPLTPPRLMPARYGFVDTPAQYFNFGPQQKVVLGPNGEPTAASAAAFGNLYAAMPSLHVGWATWSALALLPLARRRWLKALLLAYPFCTIFAIVVTGNHWFLDALGGWVVLAAGYALALLWERARATRGRRLA